MYAFTSSYHSSLQLPIRFHNRIRLTDKGGLSISVVMFPFVSFVSFICFKQKQYDMIQYDRIKSQSHKIKIALRILQGE